jgi:hypothetical protein
VVAERLERKASELKRGAVRGLGETAPEQ